MRTLGSRAITALAVATSTLVSPAGAQEASSCLGQAATIVAEAGVITFGTDGADIIVGTPGPDIIHGLGGDDVICGFDGADTIAGDAGDDILAGGRGADVLDGGGGHDDLRGGRGHDELRGRRGRDVLVGGRGHDELFGGRGVDELFGRNGNDAMHGGSRDDTCAGGPGDDTVSSCNEAPPHTSYVHTVGDSVLLGTTTAFCNTLGGQVPEVVENAAVSRQFSAAFGIVSEAVAVGVPDDAVFVIALGSNGPFSGAALDALVGIDESSRFLFVNVKEPRPWEASVNSTLAAGVARHADRSGLVDWHTLASANPGYLGVDGIHLTCTGAAVYAAAIADGLRGLPPA